MDTFDRFKMGAMMGATVGGCMGAIFGTYAVLRHGHGGAGFFPVVGKMALQSGGTFGMFMGIGSLIRSDSDLAGDGVAGDGEEDLHMVTAMRRRNGVYRTMFMRD